MGPVGKSILDERDSLALGCFLLVSCLLLLVRIGVLPVDDFQVLFLQSGSVFVDTLELFVNNRIDLRHEVVSSRLIKLLVLESYLVEAHDFKGKVGDSLQEVLAQCICEFAFRSFLDTNHLISLVDLLLEDFDDTAVLFVYAANISLCLPLHKILVAILVADRAPREEAFLQKIPLVECEQPGLLSFLFQSMLLVIFEYSHTLLEGVVASIQ